MKNYSLSLKFKEDRNYIQGSEIYNEIERILEKDLELSGISSFRIAIHKIIERESLLFLTKDFESELKKEEASAIISFKTKEETWKGYIIDSGDKISERISYNEQEVFESVVLDKGIKSVFINEFLDCSLIDLIVTANKYLHLNLYGDLGGKWLFTKMEINKMLAEITCKNIQIKIVKNFKGLLTKSTIVVDNEKIGEIYFSRKDKI